VALHFENHFEAIFFLKKPERLNVEVVLIEFPERTIAFSSKNEKSLTIRIDLPDICFSNNKLKLKYISILFSH
jgi:hypothetical protein